MIINIHEDAGHAWAQVKRKELDALGISSKITGYSYQNFDDVYLEEDNDLYVYISALKKKYGDGLKIEYKTVWDGNSSIIRSYRHFAA